MKEEFGGLNYIGTKYDTPITFEKGNIYALEGLDGSGKTTLFNQLKDYFKHDENIVFVREPGSTECSEKIRELLLSDEYSVRADNNSDIVLFAAARISLYVNTVLPALEAGKIVISDRSVVSSIALQNDYVPLQNGVDIDKEIYRNDANMKRIYDINSIVPYNKLKILFLNVPIDTCMDRIAGRGDSNNNFRDYVTHTQMTKRYNSYRATFQFLKDEVEVLYIHK